MLCTRAAILENGRIREQGIPERMARESEAFRTLFAVGKEGDDD